eukprot:963582-Pleurochrysis_carterae.AAC.1
MVVTVICCRGINLIVICYRGANVTVKLKQALLTTRPVTPKSARLHLDYTVTREAESLLDQVVAMRFGVSAHTRTNRAKMHKCQCQNMQMRMHGDQSRSVSFQSDPRVRGS